MSEIVLKMDDGKDDSLELDVSLSGELDASALDDGTIILMTADKAIVVNESVKLKQAKPVEKTAAKKTVAKKATTKGKDK